MSHSTHVGFREPPTCVLRFEPGLDLCAERPPPRSASPRVGVGHCSASFTARPSSFPDGPGRRGPGWQIPCGVGHVRCCTTLSRFGNRVCAFAIASSVNSAAIAEHARGVGHKPDPVPPVRGANGRSRYAVPLRVIPARGQVSENTSESPTKES
jgi:hypothetical protein